MRNGMFFALSPSHPGILSIGLVGCNFENANLAAELLHAKSVTIGGRLLKSAGSTA
jgi:hypothetical protein